MFGFKSNAEAMDAMIITSSANADMLIQEFDKRIQMGYNPNDICDEVFAAVGCSAQDLTPADYKRVQNSIEKLWRLYHA